MIIGKIIFNNIQLHLPTIQEKNITYKLLGENYSYPMQIGIGMNR